MIKPWTYLILKNGVQVKVDTEDLPRIHQHNWRVIVKPSGRQTVVTRIKVGESRKQLSLGAFLLQPPEGKMVYPRRFKAGLDYRKENLVICTMQERQLYLPKTRKASSSKYRGVYFLPSKSKWRAGIKVNGKNITIGLFASEAEAAQAYNRAARKHFGDLAYQNRIDASELERRGPKKDPKSA